MSPVIRHTSSFARNSFPIVIASAIPLGLFELHKISLYLFGNHNQDTY